MTYQLFQNYNPNRKTPNERYQWYFTKTQTRYSRGLITFESKSSLQWYLDRVKEADEYAAKIEYIPSYPTPSRWVTAGTEMRCGMNFYWTNSITGKGTFVSASKEKAERILQKYFEATIAPIPGVKYNKRARPWAGTIVPKWLEFPK